jgi:hypothetical protein
LSGSSSAQLIVTSAYVDGSGSVFVNVTARATLPSSSIITFTVASPAIVVPSGGVVAGAQYPLSWLRADGSAGLAVLAQGFFENIQAVSYFVAKSVQLTNPAAGAPTGLVLNWELAAATSQSDVIAFKLPGFVFAGINSNSIVVTGTVAPYVVCTWTSSLFELRIVFQRWVKSTCSLLILSHYSTLFGK